jgi:hypothetical protein
MVHLVDSSMSMFTVCYILELLDIPYLRADFFPHCIRNTNAMGEIGCACSPQAHNRAFLDRCHMNMKLGCLVVERFGHPIKALLTAADLPAREFADRAAPVGAPVVLSAGDGGPECTIQARAYRPNTRYAPAPRPPAHQPPCPAHQPPTPAPPRRRRCKDTYPSVKMVLVAAHPSMSMRPNLAPSHALHMGVPMAALQQARAEDANPESTAAVCYLSMVSLLLAFVAAALKARELLAPAHAGPSAQHMWDALRCTPLYQHLLPYGMLLKGVGSQFSQADMAEVKRLARLHTNQLTTMTGALRGRATPLRGRDVDLRGEVWDEAAALRSLKGLHLEAPAVMTSKNGCDAPACMQSSPWCAAPVAPPPPPPPRSPHPRPEVSCSLLAAIANAQPPAEQGSGQADGEDEMLRRCGAALAAQTSAQRQNFGVLCSRAETPMVSQARRPPASATRPVAHSRPATPPHPPSLVQDDAELAKVFSAVAAAAAEAPTTGGTAAATNAVTEAAKRAFDRHLNQAK